MCHLQQLSRTASRHHSQASGLAAQMADAGGTDSDAYSEDEYSDEFGEGSAVVDATPRSEHRTKSGGASGHDSGSVLDEDASASQPLAATTSDASMPDIQAEADTSVSPPSHDTPEAGEARRDASVDAMVKQAADSGPGDGNSRKTVPNDSAGEDEPLLASPTPRAPADTSDTPRRNQPLPESTRSSPSIESDQGFSPGASFRSQAAVHASQVAAMAEPGRAAAAELQPTSPSQQPTSGLAVSTGGGSESPGGRSFSRKKQLKLPSKLARSPQIDVPDTPATPQHLKVRMKGMDARFVSHLTRFTAAVGKLA